MARRGSRARRDGRKRDISFIPRPRLLPTVVIPPLRLPLIEDRRRFHPLREYRPAMSLRRSDARVVIDRPRQRPFSFPDVFRFQVPRRVAICVRRKRRREALFALNRTGKGSRAPKSRNYWSDVSCGAL